MAKKLVKGNEAIAEAAIQAGCRCFFGYPITPQNQIPEYMSKRMPEEGRSFVQAESEVAAINMIYGAAGAGVRCMTSSSSPGISLKQEGISYIACAELPCLIVNIVRGGPGLGGIQASQSDYFQATRGGGHGDYRVPTFAPCSVQEAVDMVYLAFDVADQYRTPVMIMGDGMIGQMMEPAEFGDYKKRDLPKKDWAATGWADKSRPRAIINSLFIEPEELFEVNKKLEAKYKLIEKNETLIEEYMCEDAEYILAAFGTTARICKNVAHDARANGIKVGVMRPITLWPFPTEAFAKAAGRVKGILTVEMNLGQMVEDVRLAVEGKVPTPFYGVTGGLVPEQKDIYSALIKMKEVR